MAKPVMVYDGDCGFCRRWIERWQGLTGAAVEYIPSSEGRVRFPSIPAEAFERSVQLVEADGRVTEGAEAVFRALACARWPGPLWLRLYRRLPGFAAASEAAYRFVARRRSFFSRLG